jgi:integrase
VEDRWTKTVRNEHGNTHTIPAPAMAEEAVGGQGMSTTRAASTLKSRSVTEFNGLVWSTPKSWERRAVLFPAALAAELSAFMVGKGRDDLVFVTPRGGVLRVSNYRKRFFRAAVETCQAADKPFPAITPHDLRHTAASLAISAGANVKAVQRMLGHAKASMTLDVYADLFDDDLDSVADSLDAAIKSAADPLRTKSAQWRAELAFQGLRTC